MDKESIRQDQTISLLISRHVHYITKKLFIIMSAFGSRGGFQHSYTNHCHQPSTPLPQKGHPHPSHPHPHNEQSQNSQPLQSHPSIDGVGGLPLSKDRHLASLSDPDRRLWLARLPSCPGLTRVTMTELDRDNWCNAAVTSHPSLRRRTYEKRKAANQHKDSGRGDDSFFWSDPLFLKILTLRILRGRVKRARQHGELETTNLGAETVRAKRGFLATQRGRMEMSVRTAVSVPFLISATFLFGLTFLRRHSPRDEG